ncbi:MAG TPA: hypothetical protein PK771_13830, partial [Spirochaetota bacterium]|nr:hypothetical protein [Spirochaetota bacterium]
NDKWHYPSYHRWHNLNLVLNIRPTNWMTITPSWTFASGAPMRKYGNSQGFYSVLNDENNNSQVVPLYSQTSEYDDELRTDFSVPFNLKISFNFYYPVIKLKIEPYFAVEDLFVALYSPKGGKTTDQYSGEQKDAPEGSVSMPIPMPSMGVKISF